MKRRKKIKHWVFCSSQFINIAWVKQKPEDSVWWPCPLKEKESALGQYSELYVRAHMSTFTHTFTYTKVVIDVRQPSSAGSGSRTQILSKSTTFP